MKRKDMVDSIAKVLKLYEGQILPSSDVASMILRTIEVYGVMAPPRLTKVTTHYGIETIMTNTWEPEDEQV